MSEEEKMIKRISIFGLSMTLLLSFIVLILSSLLSSFVTLIGGVFSIFFFLMLKGIAFKFLEKKSIFYVLLYIGRLSLIGLVFYAIIQISKKDVIYFFLGFLTMVFAIMIEAVFQFLKLKKGT